MAEPQATDPPAASPDTNLAPVVDAEPVSGLQEPEYDVQVQLSDLQKDTEHPLGSATTFEQLGLYVRLRSAVGDVTR